jgi:ammonia channel protein AmtB
MKKLLRRFLKAASWTLFSCITTIIVSGAAVQDMVFALGYACMMAPLILYVSLGLIPVFMAHEWVWDDGGKA